ncbi:hypothetical protein DKX38_004303 [Salix brachista]|uniref:RRM domain-containing protein n=1 Tax=Salix brachista TaxID=2182728 RepID=A0A5N5NAF2_9ROSI|nr:hypothetical protein DKX38_004303 [Salix brachista]
MSVLEVDKSSDVLMMGAFDTMSHVLFTNQMLLFLGFHVNLVGHCFLGSKLFIFSLFFSFFKVKTVKVSNVSLGASEQDLKEFFSFSGDIEYAEMKSENEQSQIAYVTFKDSQGADTAVLLSFRILYVQIVINNHPLIIAKLYSFENHRPFEFDICDPKDLIWVLGQQFPYVHPRHYFDRLIPITFWSLSDHVHGVIQICGLTCANHKRKADNTISRGGATIVDLPVTVTLDPDYQLPPAALAALSAAENKAPSDESALRKAEDVVTGMLAKGFILGKDAINKAKSFDEKHQLTSTASAKVASLDKKIGLTEKISASTTVVGDKVREVDQKFQVSEKTKSAFAAAEQKVSSAGSAIMSNRYVFTGAAWVTGAFSKVAKAAGDVGQMAKEKVGMSEEEQKRKMVDDYAQVHLSESPKASAASEQQLSKPPPAEGLIL